MSLINSRLSSIIENIEENKNRVDTGRYNCISFEDYYPVLSTYLAGIMKGVYYIVTANSGVGKSKFTKNTFVYLPYHFYTQHKDNFDIDIHIKYFALEESLDEFTYGVICRYLFILYGIRIDTLELTSMFKKSISRDILDKVKVIEKKVLRPLFEKIEVVDSVHNPFGIYKHCRDYSETIGTHYYSIMDKKKAAPYNLRDEITKKEYLSISDPNIKKLYKYERFIQDNPELYNIIVTDHISLLHPESKKYPKDTLWDAMGRFSADHCSTNMRKHWKFSVVNVQQQQQSGENVDHLKAGRLEPSMDKLGNNKETQRDALVILGIFDPSRFEMPKYRGYNVKALREKIRSVLVLKNRVGKSGLVKAMLFDGVTDNFKELPVPIINNQPNPILSEIYKKLEK